MTHQFEDPDYMVCRAWLKERGFLVNKFGKWGREGKVVRIAYDHAAQTNLVYITEGVWDSTLPDPNYDSGKQHNAKRKTAVGRSRNKAPKKAVAKRRKRQGNGDGLRPELVNDSTSRAEAGTGGTQTGSAGQDGNADHSGRKGDK